MVFADYDKIENFMNIYAQMDPKSHPLIAVWAIKGPTFEVFGSVLRNAFFSPIIPRLKLALGVLTSVEQLVLVVRPPWSA